MTKWGIHFDVANAALKVAELEEISSAPNFWQNMEEAQKLLQQSKQLKNKIADFEAIKAEYEDLTTLIQMGIEEREESIIPEAREASKAFIKKYEQKRIATLLSGEYDKNNAIITLHSGAGGTEACDWTEMLYRMYLHWAEKQGYSVELLDYLEGEGAGIKSVTVQFNGENAYGYMSAEKGVHRLVRISPFDSSGRRHTSFASCDVMPELDDSIDVDIKPEDLRVDTYHSSGAGGQHVNKTESAIRITHFPTGVVVQCQNERSQIQNRDRAMKMLKAKIFEIRRAEQAEKVSGVRGEVKDIGWSSQIRSYVFHPYSMVKDHRTDAETGNVAAVMDGEIDQFVNAYLIWKATNK
ncbi:peptide chain release factor 2 [Clostridia bacterium]|nr:peptide chain release factor 2 [Clostridia bacterium]GHV39698.1 peptide chain release factor 2 [Clostridia bacterium]